VDVRTADAFFSLADLQAVATALRAIGGTALNSGASIATVSRAGADAMSASPSSITRASLLRDFGVMTPDVARNLRKIVSELHARLSSEAALLAEDDIAPPAARADASLPSPPAAPTMRPMGVFDSCLEIFWGDSVLRRRLMHLCAVYVPGVLLCAEPLMSGTAAQMSPAADGTTPDGGMGTPATAAALLLAVYRVVRGLQSIAVAFVVGDALELMDRAKSAVPGDDEGGNDANSTVDGGSRRGGAVGRSTHGPSLASGSVGMATPRGQGHNHVDESLGSAIAPGPYYQHYEPSYLGAGTNGASPVPLVHPSVPGLEMSGRGVALRTPPPPSQDHSPTVLTPRMPTSTAASPNFEAVTPGPLFSGGGPQQALPRVSSPVPRPMAMAGSQSRLDSPTHGLDVHPPQRELSPQRPLPRAGSAGGVFASPPGASPPPPLPPWVGPNARLSVPRTGSALRGQTPTPTVAPAAAPAQQRPVPDIAPAPRAAGGSPMRTGSTAFSGTGTTVVSAEVAAMMLGADDATEAVASSAVNITGVPLVTPDRTIPLLDPGRAERPLGSSRSLEETVTLGSIARGMAPAARSTPRAALAAGATLRPSQLAGAGGFASGTHRPSTDVDVLLEGTPINHNAFGLGAASALAGSSMNRSGSETMHLPSSASPTPRAEDYAGGVPAMGAPRRAAPLRPARPVLTTDAKPVTAPPAGATVSSATIGAVARGAATLPTTV
jgi:hypothetical protein